VFPCELGGKRLLTKTLGGSETLNRILFVLSFFKVWRHWSSALRLVRGLDRNVLKQERGQEYLRQPLLFSLSSANPLKIVDDGVLDNKS